jgi:hypothetical protein
VTTIKFTPSFSEEVMGRGLDDVAKTVNGALTAAGIDWSFCAMRSHDSHVHVIAYSDKTKKARDLKIGIKAELAKTCTRYSPVKRYTGFTVFTEYYFARGWRRPQSRFKVKPQPDGSFHLNTSALVEVVKRWQKDVQAANEDATIIEGKIKTATATLDRLRLTFPRGGRFLSANTTNAGPAPTTFRIELPYLTPDEAQAVMAALEPLLPV